MDLIIPRNTFNSEYRDNYVAKIVIQQYAPSPSTENNGSASNNPIYGINLFEAFPVIVAPQAVSWANEDVQRLTVTFSYTKWETSNMSNSYLVPNHSTAVNGLDSIVVTPDIGIGELSPTLDQDISNLINGFSIPNL